MAGGKHRKPSSSPRPADREADAPGMKTNEDVLVLQHDGMRLVLAPRLGGSIREFKWRGEDVLRPASAGAGDDPFQMACFPMVPFANRVAHGRFDFDGRTVRLLPNWS